MSNNVRQSPSYQLSKTPPKLSNKHVLLKNNSSKSTKKLGKSRNTTNNNSADYSHNHNKPLKVVHISNPMRFKATAAEFRALVQGLTGRDAVVIDDDDNNNNYYHHHHFSGTKQDEAPAEEENGDGSDDAHHHHRQHHHHGCANNNSSESSNDDDEKVLFHHHQEHHQHHQEEVDEVNLSTCLGTSSFDQMMSFDCYGEFKGDLDVMEDLRAFMGDDIHY